MNALFGAGLSYWNIRRKGDTISFSFLCRNRKKVLDLLDKIPSAVYIIYDRGFPSIIRRYRYRPGIAAGIVLFCISLWFSTLFVWDVRITGNQTLEEGYIRSCLAEFGCKTGAYYPKLDLYELTTQYLEKYDDICWLSVNMKGNIAYVEVREADPKPDTGDKSTQPANIVAAASGVVTAVYVYGGDPVVKTGDSVSAGQLLISGFCIDRYETIRLVRAVGEVWAQTERTITVQVPYEDVRREYTGVTQSYRTARFFGLEVPLYFGDAKELPDSDRLTKEEPLTFLDTVRTPILIYSEDYVQYREVSFTRTPQQAQAEALRRMEEEMRTQLSGAEIKQISKYAFDSTDDAGKLCYTLRYEVTCVENIALTKEIETPQEKGTL